MSARDLRIGIRSPATLARQRRLLAIAPIAPDTPRSAQRRWMDAAIKHYEAGVRRVDVLLADYDARTSRAKRRESAASEIANGRAMLQRFAALDANEPAPTRFQLKPAAVDVLGTIVTMGADLAYEQPEGWLVRQLLTDHEITRPEHLRLYAAAVVLHFEARPDGGPVVRVELWRLRAENAVDGWPRSLLTSALPSLAARLDEIARGAGGQAR